MGKRLLLCAVALLVLLCGVALAEGTTIVHSGYCGDDASVNNRNVDWYLDDAGTLMITGTGGIDIYRGSANYHDVWRDYRSDIRNVVIEEGITRIGKDTFDNCQNLLSVSMPESLMRIEDHAFSSCSSLRSVVIPDGVTYIGVSAFNGCESLQSIRLPAGLSGIESCTFYNCTSLQKISIPMGVTVIGYDAFMSCSSLTSVNIPATVQAIEDMAFYECESLRYISIPGSVRTIGNAAFKYCSAMADVAIAVGVESIGDYAFSGCSSMYRVQFPMSLTSIGWSAFSDCSSLRSVFIPGTVGTIQGYTFKNCTSMTRAYIGRGITSLESCAFSECSSLSEVELPKGLRTIDGAFDGCSSLSSIILPSTVDTLGSCAFRYCSMKYIALPEGLETIGQFAFQSCNNLRSITIPDTVESIGRGAFSSCENLSSIHLPKYLDAIEMETFEYCGNLTDITVPKAVERIGTAAFRECGNLRSIRLREGLQIIEESAFYGCDGLRSITIPASVESIGDAAFYTSPYFSESLEKIMFLGRSLPALGNEVFGASFAAKSSALATSAASGTHAIYCYAGSEVAAWAAENGFDCVYIDGMDLSTPISFALPGDAQMQPGEIRIVTPELFPQTTSAEISWKSSNTGVVSIEDGALVAHAEGTAVITASCGGSSDQMTVAVVVPLEGFELSETELWLVIGETAQLRISDLQPAGVSDAFSWTSSDTSCAQVDGNGRVTALATGDAEITVTSDGGIARRCRVYVRNPVTAIVLDETQIQMEQYFDALIVANVTAGTESFVNRLVSFTSSNEAIATVDSAGCVHAVAPGTATVTVAAASGVSASCTVRITAHTHSLVVTPAVPATHVTEGMTEGSYCTSCGTVLSEQQEIPVVEVPQKLVLPAELNTIEAGAFAGDSFVCAVLPEGCTEIGAAAFGNCTQLRFIEIPASVTAIDGSAFAGCSDQLIIVTVSGSEAERFAGENGITCVLL